MEEETINSPFLPGNLGRSREGDRVQCVRRGTPAPRRRKIKGSLLLRVLLLPASVREASLAPGLSEGEKVHTHALAFPQMDSWERVWKEYLSQKLFEEGKGRRSGEELPRKTNSN